MNLKLIQSRRTTSPRRVACGDLGRASQTALRLLAALAFLLTSLPLSLLVSRAPALTPRAVEAATSTRVAASEAAPELTGPDDGATASDMAPRLSWTNPPGTTLYHLQVLPAPNPFTGAPDGPGIDLIIGDPALVAQASYQVQAPRIGEGNYVLLPGMTYTWRVRTAAASAALGAEDPRWGPWAGRTFRTPPIDGAVLSPVSPSEGSVVTSRTPTLQWASSDPRVFYYEVQVSKDATFTTDPGTATAMVYWELRHGGVTSPMNSYTVPAAIPLESGAKYYWRVRPRVQGDGEQVRWSPAPWFTVGTTGGGPALLVRVVVAGRSGAPPPPGVDVPSQPPTSPLAAVPVRAVNPDAPSTMAAQFSNAQGEARFALPPGRYWVFVPWLAEIPGYPGAPAAGSYLPDGTLVLANAEALVPDQGAVEVTLTAVIALA